MRRAPLFTAVVLLTLAIGIGANTAMFSVIYTVLLKPIPFQEPDRLVSLSLTAPGVNILDLKYGPSNYFSTREEAKSFEDLGLWTGSTSSVTGIGEPEELRDLVVTDGLLPLLRVKPYIGRLFTRADDQPGVNRTVLISYGYFQRKFGGSPSVLGRRIQIDGNDTEIIGVLPQDFRFLNRRFDLVFPFGFDRAKVFMGNFSYNAIARLKPGITKEAAQADLTRILTLIPSKFPPPPGLNPKIMEDARFASIMKSLQEDLVGDSSRLLWVLMAAVGIVLFIACANVANLLLVKADGRQQELAVRSALGASWSELAREILTETLSLGLIGGILGVGLAAAAMQLLIRLAPANLPRVDELAIEPLTLLFAFTISLLAGLSFGLVPVLRYANPALQTALRAGTRNASESSHRRRTRDLLVVFQVTLALVLLIGSGLMIRTSLAMRQVDPGFTGPEHLLTFRLSIPEGRIAKPERAAATQQEIVRRLAEIPGVQSVSLSSGVPMDGTSNFDPIFIEQFPSAEGKLPPVRRFKHIGPGYFSTMGNRLHAGRDFTWTDILEARPVVIISRNLAAEYWPNPQQAIGKRVRENTKGTWREIIGVAGEEHDAGLEQKAASTAFWPLLKRDFWSQPLHLQRYVTFVIRSNRAGSQAFTRDVEKAVWSVNPQLPLANINTVEELMDASMARTSFTLVMLSLAAGMALLLGIVGIYGVISYSISQRTREIGIRIALGAPAANVERMFLRHGLTLAAIGIACGIGLSIPLSSLMESLLYQTAPTDPLTYGAVGLFLLATAALAAWLPARRASRIPPVEALRGD